MATLERAVEIAAQAHAGQIDKAGAPYLLHPLRLMLGMETTEQRIAAVLHDVVEDSAWTFDRLRDAGFADDVIRAIDSVTRRDGETYEDFVRRAAQDPIGRVIKLADLDDNSDLSRISEPVERDYRRIEKYRRAIKIIEETA